MMEIAHEDQQSEAGMTELHVRDIMRKSVITSSMKETILDAAKKMSEYGIGSVVITDDDKPVGIVTERDIVRKVVSRDMSAKEVSVFDVMSTPLISIAPDVEVIDAVRMMKERDVKRLIVFKNGEMVGIITDNDVIRCHPGITRVISDMIDSSRRLAPQEVKGWLLGFCEECGNYSFALEYVGNRLICEVCREKLS
jgi:Predicted signal-transduction protein containing cAMP-binding and CBS domains